MQARQFEDVAEFYSQVEAFLLPREAQHNLILGIVTTLMKTDTVQAPPYLAYVEDGGQVVLAAVRTPPYNLVLSETVDPRRLIPLADDVATVFDTLPGVVGPTGLASAFAEIWSARSGQPHHLRRAERIYRLERVNPPQAVAGTYRPAVEGDRELLVEWFMAFFAEATDAISREDAEHVVELRLNVDPKIRGLRLWCHPDGQPVSLAGYSGPTPNGIRIGPVYTPPERRGRGYASACVAALSQELLDDGRKFCFLFTDLANPTSNHIYQALGYEPVCDVDEIHFEPRQGELQDSH